MSIHVMNRVWRESPAKGSELLLLLAIADFADDDGVAWPGVETLAKKARLSKRQTQYNIRSLVTAGLLQVEENAGPKGTHRYRVMGVQCLHGANAARVQPIARGGAKSDTKGVQPIAPEPSIEPPKNHQPTRAKSGKRSRFAYTDEFEAFWQAYPKVRRVAKAEAFAEWEAIGPDDDLRDRIMAAITRQAKHRKDWQKENGKYIPHPSRWLKYGRWDDEMDDAPSERRFEV